MLTTRSNGDDCNDDYDENNDGQDNTGHHGVNDNDGNNESVDHTGNSDNNDNNDTIDNNGNRCDDDNSETTDKKYGKYNNASFIVLIAMLLRTVIASASDDDQL